MPTITEAHVVLIKSNKNSFDMCNQDVREYDNPTPWEQYLEQHNNVRPQKFQVHLVVSGFAEREEARSFAENFMSYGSIFVFGSKKRPLFRLEVETEGCGA